MDSAGYCANPGCRASLYEEFQDGRVATVYDLAHIIARSRQGPRGEEPLGEDERDAYRNLILLCPRCHRLVDGNPAEYPVHMLGEWKRQHRALSRKLFAGVAGTRAELRTMLGPLLAENRAIHEAYGPESGYPADLQDESARMWHQQVMATIIPNNRQIYATLSSNEHLLSDSEKRTLRLFYSHMIGLEFNYLSGDKNPAVPRFPPEMEDLLKGTLGG